MREKNRFLKRIAAALMAMLMISCSIGSSFCVLADDAERTVRLFARGEDTLAPAKVALDKSKSLFSVTFDYQNGTKEEVAIEEDGIIDQSLLDTMSEKGKSADGSMTVYGWYKEAILKNKWNPAADKATDGLTLYADWGYTKAEILKMAEGKYFKNPKLSYGYLVSDGYLYDVPNGIPERIGEPVKTGNKYKALFTEGYEKYYAIFTVENGKVTMLNHHLETYSGTEDYNFTPSWYVKCDSNGGGNSTGCLVYDGEAAVRPENDPEKGNLVFDNWYTEKTGGSVYDFSQKVYNNFTIYAHWNAEVKFDANDGSAESVLHAETVPEGGKVSAWTVPERFGYTFVCWTTDPEGKNEYDFSSPVNASMTLYAKWKGAPCTVYFDLNGHGLENLMPSPVNTTYGSKITQPLNQYDALYEFDGWYKEKVCANKWDFNTDTVEDDITLYAGWISPCTVSFVARGEEILEPAKVKIGMCLAEPEVPENVPYTVDGWFSDEGLTQPWKFETFAVREDMTLYARIYTDCRVQFVTEHGTAPSFQTVKYGKTVNKPADPYEDRYIFDGWYKDAEYKTPWDFEKDTAPEWQLILYAKWKECTYTGFDPMNGEEGLILDAVIGEKIDRTKIPEYTNGDKVLEGWYTEKTYQNYFDLGYDLVKKDMILYARWLDPCSVTFDYKNGTRHTITAGEGGVIDRSLLEEMSEKEEPSDGTMIICGWYKDADIKNKWDPGADKATDGLTLYADWEYTRTGLLKIAEGKYFKNPDLSYGYVVQNGRLYDVPNGVGVQIGEPVRNGNKYKALFTEGYEKYYVIFTVENGEVTLLNHHLETYSGTEDYDFTPCWYVKCDPNGGWNGTGCLVYDGEKALKPESIPSWDDHIFEYYCTDQACTTAYDWDTVVHENFTIYAKWSGIMTVKFNMNGHGTAQDAIKVSSGGTITLPDEPKENGYKFTGWYKDPECSVLWDESTQILANTTIYAGWEDAVLTEIAITKAPKLTEYYDGESFDPEGMVVTAYYSDGTSHAVTDYLIQPKGALTTDVTQITVSYTEGEETKKANHSIMVYPEYTVRFEMNGVVLLPCVRTVHHKISKLSDPESPEGTSFRYWTDADGNKVTEAKVYTETTCLTATYLINSVSVTLEEPVLGEALDTYPDFAFRGADQVLPVEWKYFNGTKYVPEENVDAQPGMKYEAVLRAYSEEGYYFTSDTKITLNEEAVDFTVTDEGRGIELICDFEQLPDHICEGELVEKEASCTEDGVNAHYECTFKGCGKWFEDAGCTKLISEEDKESYIIAATGHDESDWDYDDAGHWTICLFCDIIVSKKAAHTDTDNNFRCDVCGYEIERPVTVEYEIIEGDGTKWTLGSDRTLRFRSNAPFGKFVSVEVDGDTVSAENYAVSEGSTVVEFSTQYAGSLKAGRHSITIVSSDGSASAHFTVLAEEKSPDTGDNSCVGLCLLIVAICAALVGTTVSIMRIRRL